MAHATITLEERLFQDEGVCSFDFFQTIRLLALLRQKDRVLVGEDGPPQREIVRFLAHRSLAFPASTIHQLVRDSPETPPRMTVTFMGLTGPSGVLPRHYTERLLNEAKGLERTALQDWLDLFNHRFISLFYRAWEKYRFYLPYERGEADQREPDAFSRTLFSLIGLGFRSHRNRLQVVVDRGPWTVDREPGSVDSTLHGSRSTVHAPPPTVLVQLDDLALLRFSGFFAHRPRCALSLETFLGVYLQLPVKVLQFQGQWLRLDGGSQTLFGPRPKNNRMGQDIVVGDRVWDVQSKVRICLGPMSYEQFVEFLPDRSPQPRRKRIFLLAQLVRFCLGAEVDVEFQLVLKKDEVPGTKMGPVSRLGWNTWSRRQAYPRDADDTVFTVIDRPQAAG